jgi:hypothetical protein
MKKTQHIAQFESFREDPRIGRPNPNAGFREGSNNYRNGVICIFDGGGAGLAVGTINSQADAAYIRELEQFVPSDNVYGDDYADQLGIQVFENYGDAGSFVTFDDQQFTLHESGETYKAKEDSFVFTIPNGKFLVLTNSYAEYELLTAKEVKDYFGR